MFASKLKPVLLCGLVALAMACGPRAGKGSAPERRSFPNVTAPTAMTGEQELLNYYLYHYWDKFLDTTKFYPCDSLLVNGVHRMEVTQQAVMYATVVARSGFEKGAAGLGAFLKKLEAFQAADTSSNVFSYLTKEICEIFYDANSPYRNEDLYATFAAPLAESRFTPDNMRTAYRYDVKMCSLNRVGTPATDFRYIDRYGRKHRLYDLRTDYTMVIFLNPGCAACEEIVEALAEPVVVNLIKDGSLTLLGMYIDEDIAAWLDKSDRLPELWKDGYDPDLIIRTDRIYNVRAIPSIYLLDREKTVILKDAPIQQVSTVLTEISNSRKK
ncbi:MAG: DUF5106 domain-containing protein [Bacteroidales bacterium]|nr:DUF5106 domain-containing protein [Bacteroidales bacterium]